MMIPDSKSRCEASVGDLSALLVGHWVTVFVVSYKIYHRLHSFLLLSHKQHIQDELSSDSAIDTALKKEAAEIIAQQLDA